jgi:hypothetical protein
MPNDKSPPKPETAPQQETGGDCVSRLVVPLSYVEWNMQGRRVHKGQKAHSFVDGQPMFLRNQTYDPTAQRRMSARLGITGPWDDAPH